MFKLLEKGKDEKRYKEFAENHFRANFQQSLEWGNVKTAWIKEVVLSENNDGKIRGSICVWIRKIPIFGNMMYVARGPVCDIYDKEVLKDLKDGADFLAKKYKAFVLRMEPDIDKDDKKFRDIITDLGFKIKDDSKNFKDEIQSRYIFRIDLQGKDKDTVFKEFHSKTRYNVRLAMKKGVEIRECGKEDLREFHKIMVETGNRDHFIVRPLSYFEKMYDELVPAGFMKVVMAYYENEPIAGIIPIFYGNKTWYAYGASSNSKRNLMPNYLLQWSMIQEAIDRGHIIYDLRGISGIVSENDPEYGLYRYKKGFGACLHEFIGDVYIPYKPLRYKLYRISEKIFRHARELMRKFFNKT